MEVETGLRKFLLTQQAVTGYVQQRVFKHSLMEPVSGTGHRAVVVRRVGTWQTPHPINTAEFPIVQVECWADADRDLDGNVSIGNAADKALAVQRVIDPLLHAKRDVRWGGLVVVSSARFTESIITTQDDFPALRLGDAAYAATRYALCVVH